MDLIVLAIIAVLFWLFSKRPGQGGGVSQTSNNPNSQNGGQLDNVAEAIARQEGYYQKGSLPQRTNNPGDVGTFGAKVSSYSDAGDGWDALNDWITSHVNAHPDWDFYDMVRYYLTGDTMGKPGPNQNPDAYAENVAGYLGVDPSSQVSQYLGG